MNNTQYICDCIREEKEFEFIEQVSQYYKLDFYKLCDFSLDLYNYHKRCGLDTNGAKIMTLQSTCEYAYNNNKVRK